MLNYEALLKKYIDHVRTCEGTDYVFYAEEGALFSADEVAALNRLADEVDADGRKLRANSGSQGMLLAAEFSGRHGGHGKGV